MKRLVFDAIAFQKENSKKNLKKIKDAKKEKRTKTTKSKNECSH